MKKIPTLFKRIYENGKSKTECREAAINRLMSEIAAGEESAIREGWIDEAEIKSTLSSRNKNFTGEL